MLMANIGDENLPSGSKRKRRVSASTSTHETRFHGDIHGPVHTGTGSIQVDSVFAGPVGTYVHGVAGHQVSTHQQVNEISAIRAIVEEANKRLAELQLTGSMADELEKHLALLQQNLTEKEPEPSVLRKGLSSLRHVLEHAAGAMIVHGVPTWLPAFSQQIDALIKRL
jgi:hypothetical protein